MKVLARGERRRGRCDVAKKKTGWAKALADYRNAHDRRWTQAEAAEKAGVALRTWINWENGHQEPGAVAQALLTHRFPDLKHP